VLLFFIDEFPECAAVKAEKLDELHQSRLDFGNNPVSWDIRKTHRELEEQTFKFQKLFN